MPIVVDTHVHIYPEYDPGRLLNDTAVRLQALAPGATPAICLTERSGQHVYAEWAQVSTVPGTDLPVERVEGRGGVALSVDTASGPLYVLPGRQVATAERLEVLILGRDLELPDGTPAADAICAGLDAGAVPVLAWAFGKWWFKRSRIVRALVRHFVPERLWLGDTTMRPREWPRGGIMRRAVANGARVVAGSDPLPGKGEAHHAGCYATLMATPLDTGDPAGSILRGFRVLPPGGHTLGHRSALPAILMRMARQKG